MAKQDQPQPREWSTGGWIKQMEGASGDHHYYSGRRRTSGLNDDHDAAGELAMINLGLQPGAIAIAKEPGLCPSCGAAINPLTTGCRC